MCPGKVGVLVSMVYLGKVHIHEIHCVLVQIRQNNYNDLCCASWRTFTSLYGEVFYVTACYCDYCVICYNIYTSTYIKSYTTAEDGGDSAAMDRVLSDKRQRKEKREEEREEEEGER